MSCSDESPDPGRPPAAGFPTTHWGRVLAAGGNDPGSREALAALCRDYWYPLYGFVRLKGHSPEDAQDLVQGLFAELLGRALCKASTRPAAASARS